MEILGEDEIFCIYEQIANRDDKKSFSIVCKNFLKFASFHLRLVCTKFPDLLLDILFTSPKMFTFECHEPFSKNHMKLIAESCPNIEHLDLYKLYDPNDHEMYKMDFDDVGLCSIANACANLVEVNLNRRSHFTEIGIGSLVRSCKNLRKLDLDCCENVSDKSLKMIGEETCLEVLSLRCCDLISDMGLVYLGNGELKHCLKTLYLNSCDRITDNGIIQLKKLVTLSTLDLSSCGANITDHGVVALCKLPNLENLDLSFLTNITDNLLLEIGRKCLKMFSLRLMGCNRITSVGLVAFYGHQTLRYLILSSRMKKSIPEERHEYFDSSHINWI